MDDIAKRPVSEWVTGTECSESVTYDLCNQREAELLKILFTSSQIYQINGQKIPEAIFLTYIIPNQVNYPELSGRAS